MIKKGKDANQKKESSREKERHSEREMTHSYLKQSSVMKSEEETWHQTVKRSQRAEGWDKSRYISLNKAKWTKLTRAVMIIKPVHLDSS